MQAPEPDVADIGRVKRHLVVPIVSRLTELERPEVAIVERARDPDVVGDLAELSGAGRATMSRTGSHPVAVY